MSKKNKKNVVDYFNMTPEEQMANAEMFHDVEKGEVSFLDALNYKVPTAPIAQSDYTKQIERACLGIIEEDDNSFLNKINTAMNDSINDEDSDDDFEDTSENEYIPYSSIVETETIVHEKVTNVIPDEDNIVKYKEETSVMHNKTIPNVDALPRIHFNYNNIIGKMIIEDGLVSTPVSVCFTSSIELDEDMIPDDADEFSHILSKIFYFIITCKHPAVIMSEDTFEIEFSLYSKINFNKFIFFKNNGFIYAYILDDGEIDNFYEVENIFDMDEKELLRYVIGAAYASNTIHNIFMHDDGDEVDSVMDARHNVKALLNLIDNDPNTEYAGHNATSDVMNRMKVNDLQAFLVDVRTLLDNLIVSDEEEDDDDDEDDDIDDSETDVDDTDDEDSIDNVDINDYPDIDIDSISMTTNTDDIDQMLEEIESTESIIAEVETTVTETTTIIEKMEPNDPDDDMVIPVIHRRS